MRAPLRAAVVGTGHISRQHLAFLRASPLAELVAVCDLSPVAGRCAAAEFGGIPFVDSAEMLAVIRPQVVHVLTPAWTHVALCRQAIAGGAHVISEKPIVTSLDQLDGLLGAAATAGVRLTESQNYRWNEPVVRARAMIDAGELGPVHDVTVAVTLPVRDPSGVFGDPNLPNPIHSMPGGVVADFLTHLTSVGLELSGIDRVSSVSTSWHNRGGGDLFRWDDLDALIVGSNAGGACHLRLRFDAWTAPDRFAVSVRGERGSIDADLFHPYLSAWVPRPGGRQLSPIVNHFVNGVRLGMTGPGNLAAKLRGRDAYEGLGRFLDMSYTALISGGPLPVDEPELRAVTGLVDRLVEDVR